MKTMTKHSFTELTAFLRAIHEPFDKIWLNFWEYHTLHPDVAIHLKRLAVDAKASGLRHYGVSAIWEVLRWHIRIEQGKTEEFKCANAYRSRYARYLMWLYPELAGFFITSALRANTTEAGE